MRTRSTIKTSNGINWYYEQEGSGPHVVLIPDGMGECQMFDKPMSIIARAGFTVTTFDTPGMSRSADAPPETYQEVTAHKLASYVISLCDALDIQEASFWGSSSGGATVLGLVAGWPGRVRNALAHEVPTILHDELAQGVELDDETIARETANIPIKMRMIEPEPWFGLGEEVHERMRNNYVRWMRGYPPHLPPSVSTKKEDLLKSPLDWTVGAMTPTGAFADNIITATKTGINFKLLAGGHFPYVCHPEEFSQYVIDTCTKYLRTP